MSNRGNIYALSARCEHAWRARPPRNHPERARWSRQFTVDARNLLTLLSRCTERIVVPPFVVVFSLENNRAYAEGREMDLDRLDPEMAPGAGLQLFAPDPNYELLPQTGWWTRYSEY